MKIIVVGCGKIGSTLVEQLAAEGHDIVVIDNDKAIAESAANLYDIMGVYGNGASRYIQLEAGADKADLLIATTSYDELNILCCITAKKLGARNTIARVRNPEYSDQLDFLREDLGLSMQINPEFAAANEIFRILRFPSAQKIETFADGRVEIVEIKLTGDLPVNGVKLRDLNRVVNAKFLICAVRRSEDVFIPSGDFTLQTGDSISLTASPGELQKLFRDWGILRRRVGSVMIVGGSRIAFYLARMLIDTGTVVKIIDNDEKRCRLLSEQLPKAMIILGDGTDQELLHAEGIEATGALVALTGTDEENVIISMYASSKKVGKAVAKVNRSALMPLVDSIGLDSVVSPIRISANIILQYVRAMHNSKGSNVETLHRIVSGKVEALEFRVKYAEKLTDIPLKNLKTIRNLLIACIIRGQKIIIPGGEDRILPGDNVIVVTTNRQLDDITDILD